MIDGLGLSIVVSDALPLSITPGEEGRRIVRHGMADVLAWLGEPVGPKPSERTHALRSGGTLFVSSHVYEELRQVPRRKSTWGVLL